MVDHKSVHSDELDEIRNVDSGKMDDIRDCLLKETGNMNSVMEKDRDVIPKFSSVEISVTEGGNKPWTWGSVKKGSKDCFKKDSKLNGFGTMGSLC